MNYLSISSLLAAPPSGEEIPSPRELFAVGVLGLDLRRAGRVALMNGIGKMLGIPPGGWAHGLSRLFVRDDIRLAGLLGVLGRERQAKAISENLQRAHRFVAGNSILALVTAARESHNAPAATGSQMVDSFNQGGLDFLADEKTRLGLPGAITGKWRPIRPFINPESGHEVRPAKIPAADQMLAYAAQINASFERNFKGHLGAALGSEAGDVLSRTSRAALLVWRAFAFLKPGGPTFDGHKTLTAQSSHGFGSMTAIGYFVDCAKNNGGDSKVDLDQVIMDSRMNALEGIRIAKARAAEALFLERLIAMARELLPY